MTTIRVAIGVIWVLAFVAGRNATSSNAAVPVAPTPAAVTVQAAQRCGTVIGGSLMEAADSPESEDPRVDLFGNEIEEAIADYRIDLRGSVYERHSPETAVQKLGSPVT